LILMHSVCAVSLVYNRAHKPSKEYA